MTELRKRMIEDMQLAGYAQRTQKSYTDAVNQLARHYQCSPDKINEEDLRRFFLYLIKDRGLSPSTIKIYLSAIKFFYEKTLGYQWRFLEFACPRKERKLPVVLSPEEVHNVLALVRKPMLRAVLTVIYCCGLRLNEAVTLKLDDIDSKRMLVRVHGKGGKDRYVPLPDATLKFLHSYWLLFQPKTWLFPSQRKTDRPICHSAVQRAFKDALRTSGIHKKASVHSLRHSYATHLLEEGQNLRVIQKLLGHKSPNTTAIYTHLTQKTIESLHESINRLMTAG